MNHTVPWAYFKCLADFFSGNGLILGEAESVIHSHDLVSGVQTEGNVQKLNSVSYRRCEQKRNQRAKNVFVKINRHYFCDLCSLAF